MAQLIVRKKGNKVEDFNFTADVITIGRADTNDLQLDSDHVSRYHAALVKCGDSYFLRDLGSLLCTKVDGEVVYRRMLENGDNIEIDDYELEYMNSYATNDLFEIGEDGSALSRDLDETTVVDDLANSEAAASFHVQKRGTLLDILKQIRISSSLSEILENVSDPIFEALCLKTMYIITSDAGSLECRFVMGVKAERGGKVRIDKSVIGLLPAEEYIHKAKGARDILAVPIRVFGDDHFDFMYSEKDISSGGFSGEEIDFVRLIARDIRKMQYPKRTTVQSSEGNQSSLHRSFRWPEKLIGNSQSMDDIRGQVRKFAASDSSLLILGETGSGKSLIAEAIHENSRRGDKPFREVNCAALPEDLIESELFGHEKGAFTGAEIQKRGLVEEANGGTLFLDEIGELPKDCQAKLNLLLEKKTFTRLGGTENIRADVRIIAATNRDLMQAVSDGTFREDVFHRLNRLLIVVPPLRERREDIPLLAHFFLDSLTEDSSSDIVGISHRAVNLLWECHDWPGNIRELRNCIERAISSLPEGRKVIFPHDLPEDLQGKREPSEVDSEIEPETLEAVEKKQIKKVMRYTGGDISKAAGILGISRPTLYKKLEKYGISRDGYPGE